MNENKRCISRPQETIKRLIRERDEACRKLYDDAKLVADLVAKNARIRADERIKIAKWLEENNLLSSEIIERIVKGEHHEIRD
jgi:hypothetical protein